MAVVCVALSCATLSGCIAFREIKDLSIVHAFSVDTDPQGYRLTFQLFDQTQGGGGGEQGKKPSGDLPIKVIDSTGKTLFDAMRNATMQVGKPLYFSNMRCIVLSEAVAKTSMAELVDFIERPPEIRPSVRLLVSRNAKASEILTTKKGDNYIPAETLEYVFINNQASAKITDINIEDITEIEAGGVSDFIVPAVRSTTTALGEKSLSVEGSAVFKRNQFAGYITATQTRGYLWSTGEVKGGIIVVEPEANRFASLEINDSSVSTQISFENDKPVFKIDVHFSTRIVELGNLNLNISDPKDLQKLIGLQNKAVEGEIQSVVNTAVHTYGADILGFGHMLYQQKPAKWRTISKTWTKDIAGIPVRIGVSSTVTNMQGVAR